jgi:hypothetical protein
MRMLMILALLAGSARAADPAALAKEIDRLVADRLKEAAVSPAPRADDAEFLRRLSLDLTGRIPSVAEVRAFLDDPAPDKRVRMIDELLDRPRHAAHFAAVWRAQLAPEIATLPEGRVFQSGFEEWLRQRFRSNAPYDETARELIAVALPGDPTEAKAVFANADQPNALAFYAVKEARPENLAAAVTRQFLGLQLECAQCHNHPFAKWSREQFWQTAAFFAGIERQGNGLFSPLIERRERRTVEFGTPSKTVSTVLLDGREAKIEASASARTALAAWVATRDNPYFARATANRVWAVFFGVGLVDPPDDFHDDNPPSHPELLDKLARELVAVNFDLRHLIRAICASETYQRTSARTHAGQDESRLYGRMIVKGLTPEQLYDSLLQATGTREPAADRGAFAQRNTPRARFLAKFASQGPIAAPQASVPQALAFMNGSATREFTTVASSPLLQGTLGLPDLTADERIEVLYLATLSRKPTTRELARARTHLGEKAEAAKYEDILWALLNSAEFRLNH